MLAVFLDSQDFCDYALLVCTELAANAVRHGCGGGHLFEMRVVVIDSYCLIEVSDASTRFPRCRTAGAEDEQGRGLDLVAALAEEMGHHLRVPIGKTVWARLELRAPKRSRTPG